MNIQINEFYGIGICDICRKITIKTLLSQL